MAALSNEVPPSNDLAKSSARLIRLRWVAGLAVLTLTPIGEYMLGVNLPDLPLYLLGASILAYNGLLWWISRLAEPRQLQTIAISQVGLDWLALAVLVHLTGGVESLAMHFFLFYVLLAPILLPKHSVYPFVGLVIAAVAGVIGLEAAGVLPHYSVRPALPSNLHHDPLYIAGKLGFFTTVALVTASLMIPIVQEFRERERHITTLYQNIRALSSSLDLPLVLKQLARSATHALNAKGALIRLVDQPEGSSKEVVSYGLSKAYTEKQTTEHEPCPIDRAVLSSNQPVIVNNVAIDERLQDPANFLAEGIHSILYVPLIGRYGPLGVLHVCGSRPNCFGDEAAEFVSAIARQGATAIENALAYDELHRIDQTKSQFVRAVTHELRSPVVGAQSLLRSVMHRTSDLNDMQRDVLRRLSDRLDALQLLIDDLLDLAAGKTEGLEDELEPMSLDTAVLTVIEQLTSQAEEKNIDLRMNYTPRGMTVMASKDGLERIFLNLIGNAIKYTPNGGQVRVNLEQHFEEAVVKVADTGIGIPEADLPHLFEEFFRARNAKQAGISGTGLGLTIIKDLVKRYKGHISVQSKLGEGTIFTVVLPLVPR